MARKQAAKARKTTDPKRSAMPILEARRKPTLAEFDTMDRAIRRNKERGSQFDVHVTTDRNGAIVDLHGEHDENFGWFEHLQDVFGAGSRQFALVELNRLIAASYVNGRDLDTARLNALVTVVDGVRPNNEIEAMLATQMAVTHSLAMDLIKRAQRAENLPQFDSASNAATKLLRTFGNQVETLTRLRRGGSQTVRVEHVHVHSGGQAIVGQVNSRDPAPGEGQATKQNQPHAKD